MEDYAMAFTDPVTTSGDVQVPMPVWSHWMSPTIGKLAAALVKAQKNYPQIVKDKIATVKSERTGKEFTYNYADLPQILKSILPVLAAEGLAFIQPTMQRGDKTYATSMLIHESGEWMRSGGLPIAVQLEGQKLGGNMTYSRRYDGTALLGVASEDDTDIQLLPNRKRPTKGGQENQTPAPPTPQPVAVADPAKAAVLKERAGLNDRIRKYIDIAGSSPVQKFVERHTGKKSLKDLPKQEYETLLASLDLAHANGGTAAVMSLVGGS